ncbi:Ig-like domain repeat protein [Nocardioides yefusunii]|uniref:Ig-like domain repeat protein n=1 Tax=Nocardioides yefusunii TaxID=2500546 RepID=A0ABW1QZY5_9ACTN|nr:Ig-like domain repeat protein [Nocardioides yefusunii]
MKTTTSTLRRGIAAAVTSALVVGTGAVLAAPANADAVVTDDLRWGLSTMAYGHLGTKTATGGASVDNAAKQLVFPVVAAEVAPDGDRIIQFGGAVNAGFGFGGSMLYSIDIVRPRLVVEADGDGRLEATVGSTGTRTDPTFAMPAKRVVVAEFSDAVVDENGSITATPDFEGVLPHGSAEAIALGVSAPATDTKPALPNEGASFHPEFLGALHADLRGSFYKSGATSDANKAPAEIQASVSAFAPVSKPTVTASVDSVDDDFTTIKIQGTNVDPGNAGIYASLVEAGGRIDWKMDTETGTASTIHTIYLTTAAFVGKNVTGFVTVPTSKIDPSKKYEILTAPAHGKVSPLQEGRTPAFAVSFATKTGLSANVKTPRAVTLTAKVTPGVAGKVSFKTGGKVVGSAAVKGGVATLKLTGLTPGKKTYTASFAPAAGSRFTASAAGNITATVVKATPKTTLKVTKKATIKKAGKVKVSVASGSLKATGKVKVSIKAPNKKKAVVKKASLKKGTVTVALPKAGKKGTYKVTVTYAGDKNLKAAKKVTKTYKVKK